MLLTVLMVSSVLRSNSLTSTCLGMVCPKGAGAGSRLTYSCVVQILYWIFKLRGGRNDANNIGGQKQTLLYSYERGTWV